MLLSKKDLERFWAKVLVLGPSDCWEWQAGKSSSGYGVFSVKRKWIGAHVVSFVIQNGYKPNSAWHRLVMHDCENPGCVNPAHLLEGTPKQNSNYPGCIQKLKSKPCWYIVQGAKHPRLGAHHSRVTKTKLSLAASKRGGWHKGMHRSLETRARISAVTRGENSGHAKLTNKLVKTIFYSSEKKSRLARALGIDASVVSRIKARKAWKHITQDL